MRLKRLELFGFKSFADRTVLDFESSLTGIVGPNGCGKSNVVDAVRWVLGEQRPTSMRGDEMADVIFKGSTSRPALAVAEVTMVLDNEPDGHRRIEDRGAEISVTRRVFKSGEGEYLIDGDRCRMKDIREMLFDTGLGSRGYAVLEQGRIDAVLSANPQQRRAIFEEAAGISRYRQRKKEAESRLARVAADLVRLDDVVGELERRSRSLKIQAGKARRFVEARDAWREDGVRLARHQLHALDHGLAALRRDLAQLEDQEARSRAAREAAEGDVEARVREQESLSSEVERTAQRASELAGDLRALDERAAQLAARVRSWETSSAEEDERAAELERKLVARGAEEDELRAAAAEAKAAAEEARERVAARQESARELAHRYAEARAEAERWNERVLERMHERAGRQNAVQHLEQGLEPLGERARRVHERRDEALRTVDDARAAAGEAQAALERAEVAVRAGEERRAAFEREADDLSREVTHLAEERAELELERTRIQSRVESLLDREAEHEHLGAGARALLEADDRPRVELAGLLADHLRTSSHAARALDAVLGARAQSMVLRDRRDAARVLAWLKERREGQVALATPDGLPEGRTAEPPESLLSEEGVEGALRSMVQPAPGYERLADVLLGDVVVVRDLEDALARVDRHPAFRFVTLEGDVVEAGAVVGGHREVTQGPVGRRSHAAELGEETAALERGIAERTARLDELGAARERKRGQLGALLEELEREKAAQAEARSAGEAARSRVEELAEAARLFERESETVERERERLEAELAAARTALAEAEQAFARDNDALARAEEARRAIEAEREDSAHADSECRVEAGRLAEKAEASERRLADLASARTEAEAELARTRRLAGEQRRSAEEGRAESEALAARRVELLEERGGLEEHLAVIRERERAGREAIEELRRRTEGTTRELEELLARAGEVRLETQRSELARDELLRRVREDFSLEPGELLADFAPEPELSGPAGSPGALALEALAARVGEEKAEMDKLGPVNLEAVEELEEVSGRLDFLTTQRDDLIAAQKTLESTLRTINVESERLFLEAFEEIRGHFRTIFRQLFGGGRAEIEMEEGVSVLEAGIEIHARPPGRETLPISLLSGGQRTMTALALLFAVFQARPSPFCVLDEVDAALDDANIGRFLGLLEDFRRHTQFIVVTHNKGTMAACDLLYGVTMAVRGVSHLVSVELADVDDFVPEATGNVEAAGGSGGASGVGGADAPPPSKRPAPGSGPERIVEVVPQGPPAPSREDVSSSR